MFRINLRRRAGLVPLLCLRFQLLQQPGQQVNHVKWQIQQAEVPLTLPALGLQRLQAGPA